jgi:hypothetical protein
MGNLPTSLDWVTYDGDVYTRPNDGDRIRVRCAGDVDGRIWEAGEEFDATFYSTLDEVPDDVGDDEVLIFWSDFAGECNLEIGDCWAYLPEEE